MLGAFDDPTALSGQGPERADFSPLSETDRNYFPLKPPIRKRSKRSLLRVGSAPLSIVVLNETRERCVDGSVPYTSSNSRQGVQCQARVTRRTLVAKDPYHEQQPTAQFHHAEYHRKPRIGATRGTQITNPSIAQLRGAGKRPWPFMLMNF